ncbi:hypothetical protein BDR06DRAFT_41066 [Suillus hirtellus]|nr:hypothetical protein BDR06DRAFT_41066 [Suillus hirtellus]
MLRKHSYFTSLTLLLPLLSADFLMYASRFTTKTVSHCGISGLGIQERSSRSFAYDVLDSSTLTSPHNFAISCKTRCLAQSSGHCTEYKLRNNTNSL